jgi:ubiquinone biosynthesis protein Coq4
MTVTISTPSKTSICNFFSGIDWREVGQAYRHFQKDPAQGILHILAAGRQSRWQAWVMTRLGRQAAALQDLPIALDLDALIQLPADTLGGAYARHMRQQGFDAMVFTHEQDGWLDRRLAIGHDVQHVIVGFDASPVGEFGLAAYCLVQFRDLLNVFVLSWFPLALLEDVRRIPRLLAAVWRGFRLGLTSRAIAAYPYEQRWHMPLSQVRAELNLR